jgi:hypothetical protein
MLIQKFGDKASAKTQDEPAPGFFALPAQGNIRDKNHGVP